MHLDFCPLWGRNPYLGKYPTLGEVYPQQNLIHVPPVGRPQCPYGRDVEPLAAIFFQFWHNFGISLRSSAGQMFSVYHTKLISWTAGPQLKNKLPRHHSKLLFRWSTSKNLISTIFAPNCFSFAIFLHSAAAWIKKNSLEGTILQSVQCCRW